MSTEQNVVKQEPAKKSNLLPNVICIIYNIISLIFAVAYLTGAFSGVMEKVTVISFINKVFSIFAFHQSLWYYYLSSMAHGVIFLFVGILIIKAVIQGFGNLKIRDAKTKITSIFAEMKNIFKYCITYIVLINMLNPTGLSEEGIFFLILGLIVLSVGELYRNMETNKNSSWKYIVSTGIYTLIKGIILFAFGLYIVTPVLKNVLENVVVLFNSLDFATGIVAVNGLYKIIGINVLHFILIVYFFEAMEEFFFGIKDANAWKKTFVVACVYLAIDVIIFASLAGGSAQVLDIVAQYFQMTDHLAIQVVLLSGAGWSTTFFPSFPKKEIY